MSRGAVLLSVVVLSLVASRPAAGVPLRAADREARARAQAMIERAREDGGGHEVVVPPRGSGLPEQYLVRYHHERHGRVVDIERDADGARMEVLDDEGPFRTPLPAAEVDALVRLMFYLHHARPRGAADVPESEEWQRIELGEHHVEITGPGFSLVTPDLQRTDVVSVELGLIAGHALEERLDAWIEADVERPEAPTEAAALADAERRLRAIPRSAVRARPDGRPSRDAVVASILGTELADAGVADAVPLLLRYELERQAAELAIRTTPDEDLPYALPGLLCSTSFELRNAAFEVVRERRARSRALVVEALGCSPSEETTVSLLGELALAPREAGPGLLEVHPLLEGHRPVEVRLAAARTLWMVERDDAAHRVLIALTRPNAERRDDVRLEALRALSTGIDPRDPRHERERRAVIQLALELMSTADAGPLVQRTIMHVGALGDARDVDGLLPWLDHAEGRIGGVALDAIEALDPARARQEARARVRRYARGEGQASYEQGVHRFAELLVRHDEQGVLDDLRAAEERLRLEHPQPDHRHRKAHAALVGYLGAAPAQRPAAAAHWLMEGGGRRPSHTRRVLLERHPSLTDHEVVRRASAG